MDISWNPTMHQDVVDINLYVNTCFSNYIIIAIDLQFQTDDYYCNFPVVKINLI